MEWGYLAEFWNKLTEVGAYPIEFFQGIGNAVGGAIGSLFDDLIHHFYDVLYIFQYLLENLGDLFAVVFKPLTWSFNFVKGFLVSAFADPPEEMIDWAFSDEILAVFSAIPYWDYLMFSLGASISVIILIFIFKRLTSI